ncbi:glycosyl transferase [Halanaerocella petrolearia]
MIPVMILVILSIILSKLGLNLVPTLLLEGRLVTENYQGEEIPVGYGLLFVLNMLIILIVGSLLGYYKVSQVQQLMILVLVMAFVGTLDDVLGDKDSQGFSGHFKVLIFKQQLTTGAIKALFSFLVVFFINFYSSYSWSNIIINTLLILLTTNFINLLDLRPGRALKVTLFWLLIILTLNFSNYLLSIPIIITVLFSLPFDLRASGMMGDVGSNVLGVIIGYLLIISFDIYVRMAIMVLFVFVHIYTEFYSLSKLINNNKILRYLDRLGRPN